MFARTLFRVFVRSLYTVVKSNRPANMPLKFAANISMMFQEIPTLAERYQAAKDAGFQFVECTFPYQENPDDLGRARVAAGLDHVLINAYPGNLAGGDLGLAALPDRVSEFREKLEMSIEFARALNCRRMHIMAGKKPKNADEKTVESMKSTYIENLKFAADRLKQEDMVGLVEAVNNRISAPDYFMSHPHQAFDIVKGINHPNLKIQFDFFHCQIMDGNLTQNLREQLPHIGHIQISQVPDRGEPDDKGEICFPYVFHLLEEVGYNGYIGLEYKPRGATLEGLGWMKELGY